jgi:hypothetical protein
MSFQRNRAGGGEKVITPKSVGSVARLAEILPFGQLFYGPVYILNTSFSLKVTNRPSKLECYIKLGWKGFPTDKHTSLLGPFVSFEES